MKRRPCWRLLSMIGLFALGACSSDDYGSVGGSLPLDVSQEGDSVLVALDPPLEATATASVSIDLPQDYTERSLLYVGNRDEGQWKATPLFVFDFSLSQLVGVALAGYEDYADSLELSEAVIDTASFRVLQSRDDQGKGIARTMDLRELDGVDTLDESLLEQDISTLLGPIVAGDSGLTTNTLTLSLSTAQALQWLRDDARVSFGLVDLTESNPEPVAEDSTLNSNFAALASVDLVLQTLFLDTDDDVSQGLEPAESLPRILIELDPQFVADELGITLDEAGDPSILVFAAEDMTHLQRVKASQQDITLSAYRPSRVWLDFDLLGSDLPGDATVNEALLTLKVRGETSLGGTALQSQPVGGGLSRLALVPDSPDTEGFEVSLAQADPADADDLPFILRSRGSINLFTEEPELVIDVTDFVQRDINLLLDDTGVGILIALTLERNILNVIDFYGVDAPDSLRPRLDVRFTPPADFWE